MLCRSNFFTCNNSQQHYKIVSIIGSHTYERLQLVDKCVSSPASHVAYFFFFFFIVLSISNCKKEEKKNSPVRVCVYIYIFCSKSPVDFSDCIYILNEKNGFTIYIRRVERITRVRTRKRNEHRVKIQPFPSFVVSGVFFFYQPLKKPKNNRLFQT